VRDGGIWWAAGVGGAAGVVGVLAVAGVDVWPLLLIAALVAALRFTGALGQVGGKSRVGTAVPSTASSVPAVQFDDVGGHDTAKQELMEALDFLRRPEAAKKLGIRALKGILFTGPPGTGKTMLAKAAANYSDAVFLAASGSEFIEMYAGVGAQRVRQLFHDARRAARRGGRGRAVVFIDEIEVMAGRRGQHTSHLEYDQTLNQLLVEMDGIDVHEDVRVLVMAATNRADLLDSALTRPGRLDRTVRVDLPDRAARRRILTIHSANKPLDESVDLDAVARDTFGFSGAHLESLCNEAAILALRAGADRIRREHFQEAVDKVLMGEKLDRAVRDEELRRVAIHEGGHALLSEVVRPGSVSQVTITPRGMALGYVRQTPDDDPLLETESELKDRIAVCLAGSAAEQLLLGERSTGAANDFEQAWAIARRMLRAGLTPLGVVDEDALSSSQVYDAVRAVIEAQSERVESLLATRRDHLERLAETLLAEETADGETLRHWLREEAS
jgi:cell division protease FtsH